MVPPPPPPLELTQSTFSPIAKDDNYSQNMDVAASQPAKQTDDPIVKSKKNSIPSKSNPKKNRKSKAKNRESYVPPGYNPWTKQDQNTPEKPQSTVIWNTQAATTNTMLKYMEDSNGIDTPYRESKASTIYRKDKLIDIDNEEQTENDYDMNSISDAHEDTESFFVSPLLLLILRIFEFSVMISYFGYAVDLIKVRFINELYGWNIILVSEYFIFAIIKSALYIRNAPQYKVFTNAMEGLFVCSGSLSAFLVLIYWLLYILEEFNQNSENWKLKMVGYNIGALVMLIEVMLSRIQIVKVYAATVPAIVVSYVFFTWYSHSELGWEWPVRYISLYLAFDKNIFDLLIYFAVLISFASTAPILLFVCVDARNTIGRKLRNPKINK